MKAHPQTLTFYEKLFKKLGREIDLQVDAGKTFEQIMPMIFENQNREEAILQLMILFRYVARQVESDGRRKREQTILKMLAARFAACVEENTVFLEFVMPPKIEHNIAGAMCVVAGHIVGMTTDDELIKGPLILLRKHRLDSDFVERLRLMATT